MNYWTRCVRGGCKTFYLGGSGAVASGLEKMLAFFYVTEMMGHISDFKAFHPIYCWQKYTIGLASAFRIVSSWTCLPLRSEGRLGLGA